MTSLGYLQPSKLSAPDVALTPPGANKYSEVSGTKRSLTGIAIPTYSEEVLWQHKFVCPSGTRNSLLD